jgi:hypothetical protein
MALRCPDRIGDKLEDFATVEIYSLLEMIMCDSCPASNCDGCPGPAIGGHLENQIGEQGIAYMKKLISEWQENSAE